MLVQERPTDRDDRDPVLDDIRFAFTALAIVLKSLLLQRERIALLVRQRGDAKSFVIVDAAMNDLIRPALYQAYHAIVPVTQAPADAAVETADIVGPVCESGDFLALGRQVPKMETGDLVAVLSAGAYGMSMASTYNSRPLPAEVFVDGDRWAVIRERGTIEALLAAETVPDWFPNER